MGAHPNSRHPVRPLLAGLALVGLLWAASPAAAQDGCEGGLPLYSPESLDVRFENLGVRGNRLIWQGVPRDLGTCFRLTVDEDLRTRIQPVVTGLYSNRFDRALVFAAEATGEVADPVRKTVLITLQNNHPNPAAVNLSGNVNLSGAGGVFRVDLDGTGEGVQVNAGIPGHLTTTDIVGLARSEDTGRVFAAVRNLPIVVSDDDGQSWAEPTERIRPPFRPRPRSIAVSPSDPDILWLNPELNGLWKSEDGGATWQRDLVLTQDPRADVSLVKYLEVVPEGGDPGDPNDRVSRLYVQVVGRGFFYSDDDGLTFQSISGFRSPLVESNPETGETVINCNIDTALNQVRVRDVVVSPTQPEKIYVGVDNWGVYLGDTSTGQLQWEQRASGIVLCQGSLDRLQGERRDAQRLLALPSADGTEDILVAVTNEPAAPAIIGEDERSNTQVFISRNSGQDWSPLPLREVLDPEDGEETLSIVALLPDPRPSRPRGVIAATTESGLWELNIEPQAGTWVKSSQQPGNETVSSVLALPNGQLLVGTSGGGVYRPGLEVDIDRVVALTVPEDELPPQLGLGLAFEGSGSIVAGERFTLTGQTFQAYAVWRARERDPETGEPQWEMIALYDLTNPEACSNTPCDEPDLVTIPGCFADKRANCFFPPEPGTAETQWEFFDRNVYNGFTYQYAVSTLDYGNTATVSPNSFTGDFVFSPRSAVESDPAALPFVELRDGENYNEVEFQVNVEISQDLDNVFVVPNPLVRRAGWDIGETSSVRFVNVTASSRVEIYTLAGDLVQELDNVVFAGEERGNIEWDTRNAEGELVASGVYIYRVTDDDGNEVVEKFTVVR